MYDKQTYKIFTKVGQKSIIFHIKAIKIKKTKESYNTQEVCI